MWQADAVVERPRWTQGVSRTRRAWGVVVELAALVVLTAVMVPWRSVLGLETVLLVYLVACVAGSLIGGLLAAVVGAALSNLLVNFFFVAPYGTFAVQQAGELADLALFLTVALGMAAVTELAARQRAHAERVQLRSEWISELSQREAGSLREALAEAREVLGMGEIVLVDDSGAVVEGSGEAGSGSHELALPAGTGLALSLRGPELIGADPSYLTALASTAGRLWRTEQLAAQARRADELARIDQVRSALLAAVGHDLRSPLAAVKASLSTLRDDEIELSDDETVELLATAEANVDRLAELIANLLDMSRLQAGVLSVRRRPTSVDEVLAEGLTIGAGRVDLEIPDDLPPVLVDPGLLERVVGNLVDNALRYLREDESVLIRADLVGDRVHLAVVDHGPGIPKERFDEVFVPFQRFDDRGHVGVGLGLAIARGFAEAMDGRLIPSATPGGGLTMTVDLEVAHGPAADR